MRFIYHKILFFFLIFFLFKNFHFKSKKNPDFSYLLFFFVTYTSYTT